MLPKNCPTSDRNLVRIQSEPCPTEIGTLSDFNRNHCPTCPGIRINCYYWFIMSFETADSIVHERLCWRTLSQPSLRNFIRTHENRALFTLFESVGWKVSLFWPMQFTIVNKISGFKHDSYGMALNKIVPEVGIAPTSPRLQRGANLPQLLGASN